MYIELLNYQEQLTNHITSFVTSMQKNINRQYSYSVAGVPAEYIERDKTDEDLYLEGVYRGTDLAKNRIFYVLNCCVDAKKYDRNTFSHTLLLDFKETRDKFNGYYLPDDPYMTGYFDLIDLVYQKISFFRKKFVYGLVTK